MIRRSSFDVRSDERYADPARPSRMLMQAVLEDAIRTFLHHTPARTTRARRIWQEEFTWLTARDRGHPFTFENVCDALGIEPRALRARVLAAAADLAGPVTP
jgi:hypothetical protein